MKRNGESSSFASAALDTDRKGAGLPSRPRRDQPVVFSGFYPSARRRAVLPDVSYVEPWRFQAVILRASEPRSAALTRINKSRPSVV